MHRTALGCVVIVACCLLALQGCSNHRPKMVDRTTRIETYSISKNQPKTVELHLIAGPDDRLKKTSITSETASEVKVRVVIHGPDPNVPAAPIGSVLTAKAVLKAPLGQRDLIDASTGKVVPKEKN